MPIRLHLTYTVHPLFVFFAYLFASYTVAALLCPLFAAAIPADRFIGRGGMILAIIGFWPFLKILGLAERNALGYGVNRAVFGRAFIFGWLIGIAILSILAFMLLTLGIRLPTPGVGLDRLAGAMIEGFIGGCAVAWVEETFFRGGLFAALRRNGNENAAVIGSSLLYAALHFFKPQPIPSGLPITLQTGFGSLIGAFPALMQPRNLNAFIALLMVGVFLALIRERSGHLGWGMGIHAGWVLVIKLCHTYSDINYHSPWVGWVSDYDGMTGWLAAVWIGLLALCVAKWPRVQDQSSRVAKSL
jgi:uncharacterized protein